MKKIQIFCCLLLIVCLSGCSATPMKWNKNESSGGSSSVMQSSEAAKASSAAKTNTAADKTSAGYFYKDIKAVWISYLELEPILKGKTQEQFRKSFEKIIKNVGDTGLNTVIVHVRPFSDALYKSKLFPPSVIWTDDDSSVKFDPLSEMLDISHTNKISFHAWVNPLRAATVSQAKGISEKYGVKKFYSEKSDKIGKVDGRYYFNPAYGDVRQLIADGVKEIVGGYAVDAVHIDDYFYPTTAKSFDEQAYKKYAGGKTLSQFRLGNCNALVKLMYSAAHTKKDVKFGVSPQGNIENNYSSQYADVKKWCSESGYADYIMPQIYYGFKNSSEPFKKVAERWKEYTAESDVLLSVGLACHKINLAVDAYAGSGRKEWANSSNVISRQIKYIMESSGYNGFALYSYKSLFSNSGAQQELDNIKSLLKQ